MNLINKIFFDCETAALPLEELRQYMPESWALGNLKDPSKIALAKMEKEAEWIEKAALSALTGRLVCIGIFDDAGFRILHGDGDEHQMLMDFWALWEDKTRIFYGFNSHGFDLKFLIRRSWHLAVKVPIPVPTRLWDLERSIDLADYWKIGDRQDYISLDNLLKFLGLPGKLGKGKDFAALWDSDRAAAEKYLERDVVSLRMIADIFGV